MKTYNKIFPLTSAFAALVLSYCSTQLAHAAPWITNGPLLLARHSHTATLLPNGEVLVVGGVGKIVGLTDSAEIYDPATGTNRPTGSLNSFRRDHTATLLLNGKVLVAGGFGGEPLVSAELYDPATGNWTPTGNMNASREFHSATLLRNGTVLVAGGRNDHGVINSAELYNPATGIWLPTLGPAHFQARSHTIRRRERGPTLIA